MEAMKRLPHGLNVHEFLREFGVQVKQPKEGRRYECRSPNVVIGGRTIARLLKNDEEATRTVIACIQASDSRRFEDIVVLSVHRVIKAHFATASRREAVAMFRVVDIGKLYERAQRLVSGEYGRLGNVAEKFECLLIDKLIGDDGE